MYYLSIPGYIITEDGLIPLTDEQKKDLIEEDDWQWATQNNLKKILLIASIILN